MHRILNKREYLNPCDWELADICSIRFFFFLSNHKLTHKSHFTNTVTVSILKQIISLKQTLKCKNKSWPIIQSYMATPPVMNSLPIQRTQFESHCFRPPVSSCDWLMPAIASICWTHIPWTYLILKEINSLPGMIGTDCAVWYHQICPMPVTSVLYKHHVASKNVKENTSNGPEIIIQESFQVLP